LQSRKNQAHRRECEIDNNLDHQDVKFSKTDFRTASQNFCTSRRSGLMQHTRRIASNANSKAAKRYGSLDGLAGLFRTGEVRYETSTKAPALHELNNS
jgi:hypothetical protein